MRDYLFSRQFLYELSAYEKTASGRGLKNLDEILAAIVQDPNLSGRVPSFYNPSSPSYLYRSGNILIHYRVTDLEKIEFLNLFWPRV